MKIVLTEKRGRVHVIDSNSLADALNPPIVVGQFVQYEGKQYERTAPGQYRETDKQPAPPKGREMYTQQRALVPERCPVCSAKAGLWAFVEKPEDPVQYAVMCDNGARFGPQDGMKNEGCLLYMPPDGFYRPTAREALAYWAEYAKALVKQREPGDGRPCHMDNFVVYLLQDADTSDGVDLFNALTYWNEGDWDKALSYLTEEHRKELKSAA